ncbi:MAG: hypothetical protein AAF589_01845 [Planctomycetota bacterium]
MQQLRLGAQHGSQQAGSQPQVGSAAQQVGSGAQQLGSQPQAGSQQAGAQQLGRLKRPFRPSSRQQLRLGAQHGSQQTGSAAQQVGSQPQEGSQPQVGSQHDGAAPQPPSRPKNALALEALLSTMATPKQSVAPRIRWFILILRRKQ